MMTIALALATNSTPIIITTQTINDEPRFAGPVFAHRQPKPMPIPCEFLPPCYNETAIREDTYVITDPMRFGDLLFNPAVAGIVEELGPAGLHILAHLALNLTEGLQRNGAAFATVEAPCIVGAQQAVLEEGLAGEVLEIAGSREFAFQLGDFRGWIMNLVRGLPAVLYDGVSGHCFRPRSYIAGGVNPLYPGVHRSDTDINSANFFCGTHRYTRSSLAHLL
jgi:hypothetical protein